MDCPAYRHSSVARVFMIDLNRFKDRLGVSVVGSQPAAAAEIQTPRQPAACPGSRSAPDGHAAFLQPVPHRSARPAAGPVVATPAISVGGVLHAPAELIQAVERGNVPEGQRGHYDLNDSMIDWTSAREANRWHRRYLRMIRHRLAS